MPLRIAVAGKGGAGKSLIAGTIARILARRGHLLLVLDSDPMPGVAISLGLGPLTDPMLTSAVEKCEDGRWKLKKGIGAARAVARFSMIAPDGVRLLQSGKATAEGLAPIMPSINGFNQVVNRLSRDAVLSTWSVLGDLPAGTRHAAFGWAPYARRFLVVVEPTWQSILTARRVARIAQSRSQVDVWFVANKTEAGGQLADVEERLGEQVSARIPPDPQARRADALGLALIDHAPESEAVKAIAELSERLVDSVA